MKIKICLTDDTVLIFNEVKSWAIEDGLLVLYDSANDVIAGTPKPQLRYFCRLKQQ